MNVFDYKARDASGRRCRGQQQAQGARHARQLLRERGLVLLELKPAAGQSRAGKGGQRLSAGQLTLLTLQLSTLVQAGLPLEEALQAVAAQSGQRRVSQLVDAVRARIIEGHDLASALAAFPRAFPAVFCATVAAGERSGHLGQVLAQLAHYTEVRQQSRQTLQLALVYPAILLCASLGIVAFLLGYVVPDVIEVFVDRGQPLPWLTEGLLLLSHGLSRYGLVLLAVLAGLAGLGRWTLRHRLWRWRAHCLLLRLPVIGRVLQAMEAARFASTLAILGKSAVPLVEALHIAAAVIASLPIRQRMQDVARRVGEGETLTRSLEQGGDMPPLMLHMIASGERAGELDRLLELAAEQQEKTLAARIALLVSLFEPAMLMFMGAVVLLIVMAILMPILNLNQQVG